MVINRIDNFTHPIGTFRDNAIGGKFANIFIVNVEFDPPIVGDNLHQERFKARFLSDIGYQMLDVDVPLAKKPRVRL